MAKRLVNTADLKMVGAQEMLAHLHKPPVRAIQRGCARIFVRWITAEEAGAHDLAPGPADPTSTAAAWGYLRSAASLCHAEPDQCDATATWSERRQGP